MKKTIILLSMAALAFVACQKEQPSSTGEFELTAAVEQQQDGAATKTYLDASLVKWSAGDEVDVWTDAATPEKIVMALASGAGTGTGKFTSADSPYGTPVYALYPSSGSSSISGSTISFTTPENQTYAAGSFGNGANVAVATISGETMSFKNVFGVLKLQLKGNFPVEKIVLTDKDSLNLWGDFTVDAGASAPVAAYSANGGVSITLTCPATGVQLDPETETDFYFVVPVGAMESGFDAKIYSTEGAVYHSTDIATASNNKIPRSIIKEMPAITVLPPEYQKLASISSTGTQYIYTGLTPSDFDSVEGAEAVVSNDSVFLFKGKTESLGTVTFKKGGKIVHQFVPCYHKGIAEIIEALPYYASIKQTEHYEPYGMYDVCSTSNNLFSALVESVINAKGLMFSAGMKVYHNQLPDKIRSSSSKSHIGAVIPVRAGHTYSWNNPVTITLAPDDSFSYGPFFSHASFVGCDYASTTQWALGGGQAANKYSYYAESDGMLVLGYGGESASKTAWTVNEGSDLYQINEGVLTAYQRPAFCLGMGDVFVGGEELYN